MKVYSSLTKSILFLSMFCLFAACQDQSTSPEDEQINEVNGNDNDDAHFFIQTFGGSEMDIGTQAIPLQDGGFLVVGRAASDDGDFSEKSNNNHDIFVLKSDESGEIDWVNTFGGTDSDQAIAAAETSNGYIIGGNFQSNNGMFTGMLEGNSDLYLMKLDTDGNQQWLEIFGGSEFDSFGSMDKTPDGGFIISGNTSSNDGIFSGLNPGDRSAFLIKTNSSGAIEWVEIYGGTNDDRGNSVAAAPEGGYILGGQTSSNDGDFDGLSVSDGMDAYMLKVDVNGDKEWIAIFGGSENQEGRDVTIGEDGSFLLTGMTPSGDGDFSEFDVEENDLFVVKLNSDGSKEWLTTLNGSGRDGGNSISPSPNGGYILTGAIESDDGDFSAATTGGLNIPLIKLDSNGNTEWIKFFGGNGWDQGSHVIPTPDNGYLITGTTRSSDADFTDFDRTANDVVLIKTDSEGEI